jgi:general secretion pathway protein N
MRNDDPIIRHHRRSHWNTCAHLSAALWFLIAIANAAAASTVKSKLESESFARGPNRPSAVKRVTIGNPLWKVPTDELVATRGRPLFSPTRRPPAPPMANVPPPRPELPVKPEKPPLVLVGTIIGGSEAIAVFRDETTKRAINLRSGESRYGWLLDRVQKRNVLLQKGDLNVLLALPADTRAPVMVAMQQPEPELVRRQRQ